jgi:DNA-3-methyladenine glycosylase
MANEPIDAQVTDAQVTDAQVIDAQVIDAQWCDRPATEVAPELIGCTLVRQLPNGPLIRSTIVETEAYLPSDPASHAYRGLSKRNAAMFGPPGHSYIYLIYGMYHCFNVVTEPAGIGSAVLIRALELKNLPPIPLTLPLSNTLQNKDPIAIKQPHRIAAGPGKLCKVLSIDRSLDGLALKPNHGLWLEHPAHPVEASDLVQTTRIGITKAVEQPWRWYLKGSKAVSKPAAAPTKLSK